MLVVHDDVDLEAGRLQARAGGGLAGHNGLRSLRDGLGGADFWRVRAGVGRPDSSDPEIVSRYVLSKFRESPEQVSELIERAADEAARLVEQIGAGGSDDVGGQEADK